MRFPFAVLPIQLLRRIGVLRPFGKKLVKGYPSLKLLLKQAKSDFDPEEYMTSILTNTLIIFVVVVIIANLFQIFLQIQAIVIGILTAGVLSIYIFTNSLLYPRLIVDRRIRNIERNLLSALQDLLAQINAGVPIFNVLVNISNADYGEVSKEFGRAVREINAGKSQVEALSDLGAANPSVFFRRTLWQISNGLTSGANMVSVVKESIKTLAEEQLLQIQEYGSQLSPLSMFYMLIAVIVPILAITFIIILSAFFAASKGAIQASLWGFYCLVVFMQLMFLGIIKSKRPNLI